MTRLKRLSLGLLALVTLLSLASSVSVSVSVDWEAPQSIERCQEWAEDT